MRKTPPAITPVIAAVLQLLIFIFLCTCGIEDYPYIYAIPQANVQQELNSRATVSIPANNSGSVFFTHFTIFYHIYVSDVMENAPSKSNLSAINSTLYSHYSSVEPYIDNDTKGSSSIGSLFSNMNYNRLALEAANIDNVLNNSVLGQIITFSFAQTPGSIPSLIIGSNTYALQRSNGGGSFSPRPTDRYFVNSPELYDPANINSTINADVTNKTGMTPGAYHSYANLYIVATGIDTQTYSQIFSTPTHVGVLRLPDTAI